jgi:hypothetical protein
MSFSLNQLDNGVLVRGDSGGLGMSDELIQLLALSEITATSYEIMNISLLRLGTNGGEQLELTDSHFYLGTESYHISGDADAISFKSDKLISIKGQNLDILGGITLSNPSNAEDIDSVIKLNQEDVRLAGNKIEITTNEFKINGVAVNPNVAQEVAENNINPVSSGAVYSYVGSKTMSSASMCQVVNYVDGIISDTIPPDQHKKAVSGQAVMNYVSEVLGNHPTSSDVSGQIGLTLKTHPIQPNSEWISLSTAQIGSGNVELNINIIVRGNVGWGVSCECGTLATDIPKPTENTYIEIDGFPADRQIYNPNPDDYETFAFRDVSRILKLVITTTGQIRAECDDQFGFLARTQKIASLSYSFNSE